MPPLATTLFDYDLPADLIAQHPAARRDDSRLLVVHRAGRSLEHRHFRDLPNYLQAGDILLRNNAAVLPARLQGRRPTGGMVECLLLRSENDPQLWRCLVRPGRRLAPGSRFSGADEVFTGTIVSRHEDGSVQVRFDTRSGESIVDLANRLGAVPLPPYIQRTDDSHRAEDLDRYQTVYARPERQVAVAAPTAGLHFTSELLEQLADTGVETADLTLHVGLGTFRPISTETIEAHEIHREIYEIPAETLRLVHGSGRRRVAVGTTTVRAVEDHLARNEPPPSASSVIAEAELFIHPPREFAGFDALITNFHQPRSTLLCLVAAFLAPGSTDGIAWLHEIYAEAIKLGYRFFSYGDAMLIL